MRLRPRNNHPYPPLYKTVLPIRLLLTLLPPMGLLAVLLLARPRIIRLSVPYLRPRRQDDAGSGVRHGW